MIFVFKPEKGCKYRYDYQKIAADLDQDRLHSNFPALQKKLAFWGREDLFFFLYFILRIDAVNHPWLVDRINEVAELNNNTVDLWAREHYKSTIITCGLNLQAVARNPEERIAIFSHTRQLAKAHLRRIKHMMEQNRLLSWVYPEVFWTVPVKEAPKWSEDEGLIVRRQGQYLEATFEAWGVVDGQPTGKHFTVLNYDDLVTVESVSTPDQMRKVSELFALSLNLGVRDGKKRLIGTRYHYNDLYATLKEQGGWHFRERPAEDPKTREPVFMTREELAHRYRTQGPYIYNSQMLLNPTADELQEFKAEWVRWYYKTPHPLNIYILVDPAHSKKKGSDYTVMVVIGLDHLGNYFLLDMVRRRCNLKERWDTLKHLVEKYPEALAVGYEQYGLQADIEYIHQMQAAEGVYFPLRHLGGNLGKTERIRRLVPLFCSGRFFLPHDGIRGDGGEDLVQVFLKEEYSLFPFARHDDMLDAMARIFDVDTQKPVVAPLSKKRTNLHELRASNWAV